MITQKDFVRALKLCWPVLAEPRRRMLATHCNAPAQTITMTQLAKVAGYSAPWEDLREVGHSELGAGLANLRR